MTDRKLLEDVRDALRAMLAHSCVADAYPEDKDGEDHAAESRATTTLSRVEAALAETEEVKVERVARAICKQHAEAMGPAWGVTFNDYWANNKAAFLDDARAAIAAMGE